MPTRPAAWLVDDTRFDAHALGGPEHPAYHPERPERLVAARAAIAKLDVDWHTVTAREATFDELTRVHDLAYVTRLEEERGKNRLLDADTYVSPRSVEAARLAAGASVALVDQLVDSDVTRGVALLRPPGHHARRDQAMGFCLLNNVAVAAAHALSRGVKRVLVLDWDVHHGNGTQELFWRSPEVLYASLHQYPFYPGTGAVNDTGEGDGRGFTVNVPLSAGSGDDVYRAAFDRTILPVAHEFAPELVLVSAGFDASVRDPLAQMRLSPDAFGWMAKAVRGVADASAGGKVGLVLEGGYDLVGLESGLHAALTGLLFGEGPEIAPPAYTPPEVLVSEKVARRSWKIG